jgi:hypothetical protein
MATLKNTIINDTGYLRLPSGTTAQRPGSPTTGMTRHNTDINAIEYWNGTDWMSNRLGFNQNTPAQSAKQIKSLNPNASNGVYWINWGGTAKQIYCEMNLQGGGWMMILNYVHLGNTNPYLTVRTSSFPLLNNEYTFGDESGSTSSGGTWGHISNSLANQFAWSEYMFYGKTNFHSRVIHFYGNHPNIVSYIKTGLGTMVPYYADTAYNANGTLYNNASIPFYVDNDRSGFSNQGDYAMTEFPIYGASTIGNPRAHWGIFGQGGRWEVDDYPNAQGAANTYAQSTIHRIWVR